MSHVLRSSRDMSEALRVCFGLRAVRLFLRTLSSNRRTRSMLLNESSPPIHYSKRKAFHACYRRTIMLYPSLFGPRSCLIHVILEKKPHMFFYLTTFFLLNLSTFFLRHVLSIPSSGCRKLMVYDTQVIALRECHDLEGKCRPHRAGQSMPCLLG